MSDAPDAILTWREPRWAYTPRWLEFLQDFFWNRFWFWFDLLATLMAAAGLAIIHLSYPQWPPQWSIDGRILIAPLCFHLALAIAGAAHTSRPPQIRISQESFLQAGAGSFDVPATDITAISISRPTPDRPTLNISYTDVNGEDADLARGIARNIDIAELQAAIDTLRPHARR